MTEKSHVGMGFEVCPVCGIEHTETVLLDRRMRNSLEPKSFTGYSLCPEHVKQKEAGYFFLIVVDNGGEHAHIKLHEADRTGELIAIRKSAWEDIFDIPVPTTDFAFIDKEGFKRIQFMHDNAMEHVSEPNMTVH